MPASANDPRRGPIEKDAIPTPNIKAAIIIDEIHAACAGKRLEANATVSGKKPEQARPANPNASTPWVPLCADDTAKNAPSISTGNASHSCRLEMRTTSTESSRRPTTSAPQNIDSAEP